MQKILRATGVSRAGLKPLLVFIYKHVIMKTKEFKFNESVVNFEIDDKNVMVNATEMAKIFNAEVWNFLRLEGTKKFIDVCLKTSEVRFFEESKSENSRFLNMKKEEDLYVSRQKSGTWMHRVLALKFAAWLNPEFELWVYSTIDEILFGQYSELDAKIKETAERKARIKFLREDIENNPPADERIQELLQLESEDKTESRKPFSQIGKKVKDEYQQQIIKIQEEKKNK